MRHPVAIVYNDFTCDTCLDRRTLEELFRLLLARAPSSTVKLNGSPVVMEPKEKEDGLYEDSGPVCN